MSSKDIKLPRELAYDKKYEEDYNALTGKGTKVIKDSPFLGKTNRDIFLYAMALGFLHKRKKKLDSPRNNIRSDALHQDGEWLVYSLAISEAKDISILLKMKEVAQIAEQYANGGFPFLLDLVKQGMGDPDRRMESDLRKILQSVPDVLEEQKPVKFDANNDSKEKEETDDSMAIIERLENKLRQLIERKLSGITANWMKERIPTHEGTMVTKWKETRDRNTRGQKLFRGGKEDSLISYSELGDLYEIMKWTKNWDECFKEIFQDRKVFESDMEQVLMIRPDKAHSRTLNDVQKAKLRAIGLHFLSLIENAEDK